MLKIVCACLQVVDCLKLECLARHCRHGLAQPPAWQSNTVIPRDFILGRLHSQPPHRRDLHVLRACHSCSRMLYFICTASMHAPVHVHNVGQWTEIARFASDHIHYTLQLVDRSTIRSAAVLCLNGHCSAVCCVCCKEMAHTSAYNAAAHLCKAVRSHCRSSPQSLQSGGLWTCLSQQLVSLRMFSALHRWVRCQMHARLCLACTHSIRLCLV